MPAEPLHPLRFHPILKELIWGGRRLGTILNKPLAPGERYAASWEVSDHRGDASRVADRPEDLVEPRLGRPPQFPLLVKYLDAHQVLSVQVHPDDDLGRRLANDNG